MVSLCWIDGLENMVVWDFCIIGLCYRPITVKYKNKNLFFFNFINFSVDRVYKIPIKN